MPKDALAVALGMVRRIGTRSLIQINASPARLPKSERAGNGPDAVHIAPDNHIQNETQHVGR